MNSVMYITLLNLTMDTIDIEDIIPIRVSTIISVSRRTDIPAFYMQEFICHMKKGYIDVPNPRNSNQVSRISLLPIDAKCISWWSKNYGPWIKCYQDNEDIFEQYAHMFNFTINGDPVLEKGVKITIDERLSQVEWMVDVFGPEVINFRFDPIVHYRFIGDDDIHDNLDNFAYIVQYMASYGINKVTFSFCIPYKNTIRRMLNRGKELVILTNKEKKHVIDSMVDICDEYGMIMASCCDTEILGSNSKIVQACCIDKNVASTLLVSKGDKLTKKSKDRGQRKECNCVVSRDVGIYSKHICPHSCDYCYANPL